MKVQHWRFFEDNHISTETLVGEDITIEERAAAVEEGAVLCCVLEAPDYDAVRALYRAHLDALWDQEDPIP